MGGLSQFLLEQLGQFMYESGVGEPGLENNFPNNLCDCGRKPEQTTRTENFSHCGRKTVLQEGDATSATAAVLDNDFSAFLAASDDQDLTTTQSLAALTTQFCVERGLSKLAESEGVLSVAVSVRSVPLAGGKSSEQGASLGGMVGT